MSLKSLSKFGRRSFSYGYPLKRPYLTKTVPGDIGIEMELEGALPSRIGPTYRDYLWIVKEDGSLRGGMEYVTNTAIPHEAARPMLELLFKDIADQHGIVRNSSRCSTHIHVNVQGLRVNQLTNFIVLWGIFEEVLVNWCGPSRIGNLFTLRLKDTARGVSMWRKFVKEGRVTFSADYKYMALNGSRLRDLGTFEIRSLEGCSSPERPVKWIDAIMRLRTLAETHEDAPTVFVDKAIDDPLSFFDEVFDGLEIKPELVEATVEDCGGSIEHAVEDGGKMMLSIAHSLDWPLVLKEVKKEYIPNPFGKDLTSETETFVIDLEAFPSVVQEAAPVPIGPVLRREIPTGTTVRLGRSWTDFVEMRRVEDNGN